MLIVAMIAGVVVLNMPPPRSSEKSEAEVFAARLDAATELAIMTGSMFGLEVSPDGYVYYRYSQGEWGASGDYRLSSGVFPADLAVEFTITDPSRKNELIDEKREEKEEDVPAPVVFITPTGETTPLTAEFTSQRAIISVTLDASGNVTMESK